VKELDQKLQKHCVAAGIDTFKLAKSNADAVEILEASLNYLICNPTTWAQQAQLAADGKWMN
jgi:large subunit ribosomal protein L21